MNTFSASKRGRTLVRLGASTLFLLIFNAVCPGKAHAVPGALDLGFGNGGLTAQSINDDNEPRDIALQTDGKILVGGSGVSGANRDFYLRRYNSDGSNDSSFSSGIDAGLVITDISGSGSSDTIVAVAVQTDGKIVVFGGTNAEGSSDFVVARYNSEDGSLDDTFNPLGSTPGIVITDFSGSGSEEIVADMVLQPDGKIVVVGMSDAAGDRDWALARYTTGGVLDTTFNPSGTTPGLVTTDISGSDDSVQAVAIQDDGKIVVAGSSLLPSDLTVGRYNENGTLDTTFNASGSIPGITSQDFSETDTFDQANDVKIQADGKIVAGGKVGSSDFLVVRYTTEGLLDTTFNASGSIPGSVTTSFSSASFDSINAIDIQADGKIVAAGIGGHDANDNSDFALARYNTDGSLDVTTFNPFVSSPGLVQTDFGDGEEEEAFAVAIQPDGKIVAAGTSTFSGNILFGVARYLGDDADVGITKTASATSVVVGDPVTYTITVTNHGSPSASGVVIKDTLTGAVTFGAISITQGTCSGTNDLTCNVGILPSGASVTLTVPVTTTAVGVLSNIASVKSNGNDPDPTNDFAAAFINVSEAVAPPVPAPSSDLSIAKAADQSSPKVGDTVVYTLTVINHGPDSADGVAVTDSIFGAFTDLSASSSQGSCAVSDHVTCNLGSLISGAGATVTVRLKVKDFGTLSNLATVVSQVNDPDLSNNSAALNLSVTAGTGGGGGCSLNRMKDLRGGWAAILLSVPILICLRRRRGRLV